MITLPIVVNVTLDESQTQYEMAVESNLEEVTLSNDTVINVSVSRIPRWEGEYTFTPSDEAIELETEGKMMEQNLVINPIPSNYGKISWNGVFLMVS